jgi:hypothetical protein
MEPIIRSLKSHCLQDKPLRKSASELQQAISTPSLINSLHAVVEPKQENAQHQQVMTLEQIQRLRADDMSPAQAAQAWTMIDIQLRQMNTQVAQVRSKRTTLVAKASGFIVNQPLQRYALPNDQGTLRVVTRTTQPTLSRAHMLDCTAAFAMINKLFPHEEQCRNFATKLVNFALANNANSTRTTTSVERVVYKDRKARAPTKLKPFAITTNTKHAVTLAESYTQEQERQTNTKRQKIQETIATRAVKRVSEVEISSQR